MTEINGIKVLSRDEAKKHRDNIIQKLYVTDIDEPLTYIHKPCNLVKKKKKLKTPKKYKKEIFRLRTLGGWSYIKKHSDEKLCGIYAIRCIINDRIYIGSSVDIKGRWEQHCFELKKGIKQNKDFQKDFKLYGFSAFEFKIVYLFENKVNRNTVYEMEQYFINKLDNIYNKQQATDHLKPKEERKYIDKIKKY